MNKLLLIISSLLLSAIPLNANVLITVRVLSPNTVALTATDSFSSVADSSVTSGDGVTLLNFLPLESAGFSGVVFNSSFTLKDTGSFMFAGGSTLPFNFAFGDGAANHDINLLSFFGGEADQPLLFTTGEVAFSGSCILVSNQFGLLLPSVGTTGDIVTGFSGLEAGGVVIGQYEVVGTSNIPEPANIGVIFGSVALVGLFVIRKKKSHGA